MNRGKIIKRSNLVKSGLIKKLRQLREDNQRRNRPQKRQDEPTALSHVYPTGILKIDTTRNQHVIILSNVVLYSPMSDSQFLDCLRGLDEFPPARFSASNMASGTFLNHHVAPKLNALYINDVRDVGYLLGICDIPSWRAVLRAVTGVLGPAARKTVKCYVDRINGDGTRYLTARTFVPKFGSQNYDLGKDIITLVRSVNLAAQFENQGNVVEPLENLRYSVVNDVGATRVELANTDQATTLELEMKGVETAALEEALGFGFKDALPKTPSTLIMHRGAGDSDVVDEKMIAVSFHLKLPAVSMETVDKYCETVSGLHNLNDVVTYLT